jgi:hypothetical protein
VARSRSRDRTRRLFEKLSPWKRKRSPPAQFGRLPSSATIPAIIIARPPNAAPPSSTVTRNEIPAIRYRSDSALLSATGGRKYLRTTTGLLRRRCRRRWRVGAARRPPGPSSPAKAGDPVFQRRLDKIEKPRRTGSPQEPVIGLAEGETRWRGWQPRWRRRRSVRSPLSPTPRPPSCRQSSSVLQIRRRR